MRTTIPDWSKFDCILAMSFTQYRDRAEKSDDELSRVGLGVKSQFSPEKSNGRFWQPYTCQRVYNFRNDFDRSLMKSIRRVETVSRQGAFSCTMFHYRLLKTAYELGVKTILLIEDDVLFLSDTERLAKAISSLPDDFDVAKLEWMFGRMQRVDSRACRNIVSRRQVSEGWIDAHGVVAAGGACTAYSRRGMKWKIDSFERAAHGGKLRANDMYERPGFLDRSLAAYLAIPPVAIQDPNVVKSVGVLSKRYDFLISGHEYGRKKNNEQRK